MKLAFSFLLLLTINLHADVVLSENGTVIKDGVSLNNASDALLNRDITSAEFMAALQAKLSEVTAAVAGAQAAQQRAEAKLKLLVDGAKEAISKPTSEQRIAASNALIMKVQASQSEEEKAALLQQQAEIAEKLAKLQAK
jgi:hypothetical protein